MRRAAPSVFCVLSLLLAAAPQEAAQAQTEIRASVTGFAPAYFAGSQPSSAMDMVNLVPGFRLQEGDVTVRGYSGGVGNVLIDGQPPASKQDKLEDILKRIPADSVERVELVRPGAAGIDMQGYPLLVNVVQKVSSHAHGRVEMEVAAFRHGIIAPRLAGQFVIGSTDVLDISGAIYRAPEEDMFGFGPRNRYSSTGVVQRLARSDQPTIDNIWMLTGNYRQPLFGGGIHVNGLYNEQRSHTSTVEHRYFPTIVDLGGPESAFHSASEAGLEYDRALWTGGETQLVAIRRGKSERTSQESNANGPDNLSTRHTDSSETIIRAVGRQRSATLILEAGAEGALNILSNHNALQVNGVPTPLPTATVHIEEDRAEFFGSSTWHIQPDLTLETSLHYEMSQLDQTGDSVLNRSLAYWKPHMLVSWDFTPQDEIRVTYEREAGQLDFNNFISMVSVVTGTVTSGNKDLAPYTLWRNGVAWEHRFAAGSAVLSGRHEEISDTVDRVAVHTPVGVYDAAGNIGHGHRDELQLDLILPLDWLPLKGFTFQGTGTYRTSSVVDATTGFSRRISNDAPMDGKATLTQDIPAWNLRWGATYKNDSDKTQYRFNELMRNHEYGRVEAFVEFKPQPDWLIRVFGRNLTDGSIYRSRLDYLGPRNSSGVDFLEGRHLSFGPSIGINVQRTFQ